LHTQSRNDHALIKEELDKQWKKKMSRKRDLELGKSLRAAAKTGDVEAIHALVSAGVPVDHCGGDSEHDYQQTALHYAAREGRKECVEALLNYGTASRQVQLCKNAFFTMSLQDIM